MCMQHSALLGLKWNSDTSVEKLQFVTLLLGLHLDNKAARPHLLAHSVSGHLALGCGSCIRLVPLRHPTPS